LDGVRDAGCREDCGDEGQIKEILWLTLRC
jgi:hypothetical protein